jgi:hypothetical protein
LTGDNTAVADTGGDIKQLDGSSQVISAQLCKFVNIVVFFARSSPFFQIVGQL